jgi:ketohexokinase
MHDCSVPHFPDEDSKLRATNLKVRRGGNCPNSLEVLQQLLSRHANHNVSSAYLISTLPARAAPATARIWDSFGVDTIIDMSRCIYREDYMEPASSYAMRSDATGSRTLISFNPLPEMTADEFIATTDGLPRSERKTWWHFEVRGKPHRHGGRSFIPPKDYATLKRENRVEYQIRH